MSSLFSLGCLILVLLAWVPGDGVSIYQDIARRDGNIRLTGFLAKEIFKRRSIDLQRGATHRAGILQPGNVGDHKTRLVVSERQSHSKEADDTGNNSTDKSESGSTDTEDGKGAPPDSKEQSSVGNSETESPLDSMFIEIRKPGLKSPIRTTVYKERGFTGLFNSCVIVPADSSKEDRSGENCYVDDAYNDRLTFSLTFRFPATALKKQFETNPPSLDVIGDSSEIAEPSFLIQTINTESSTGEVSIAYGCKSSSSGTIALQVTLHFGEGKGNSTTIRWKKVCENQRNDKIEVGYLLNEKGSSDVTRQPFPSGESPLVVAPNDVSTEVYIKLGQAGAQQAFLAPHITSSNPDVTPVTVRGNHPSGGVLKGLEQATLQVNYDCATKGLSDISMSIGIPPFENLTATWKKDCGGRPATSLQVGTSEGAHDVVENGNPTPRYMVAIENIGTAHSDEHLHLPGNQSDWTVYVTNAETDSGPPAASEAALHVGRITLTIEHPNTVAALLRKVSSRGMAGWREQTTAEYIVAPGESLKVSFHFLCRAIGESRVLISVPILGYDTLEFGLAKECTYVGTAHKARTLVWTVGNVFTAGVFAFLLLISIWWWRRRKAIVAKGFEALPVTER